PYRRAGPVGKAPGWVGGRGEQQPYDPQTGPLPAPAGDFSADHSLEPGQAQLSGPGQVSARSLPPMIFGSLDGLMLQRRVSRPSWPSHDSNSPLPIHHRRVVVLDAADLRAFSPLHCCRSHTRSDSTWVPVNLTRQQRGAWTQLPGPLGRRGGQLSDDSGSREGLGWHRSVEVPGDGDRAIAGVADVLPGSQEEVRRGAELVDLVLTREQKDAAAFMNVIDVSLSGR